MLGGSRVVALQPETDSVRVLFPTDSSERAYTGQGGSWQQLDNGNRLLVISEEGKIMEVQPNGKTVWEWQIDSYDNDRVPSSVQGRQISLPRRQVEAWPCSSDPS